MEVAVRQFDSWQLAVGGSAKFKKNRSMVIAVLRFFFCNEKKSACAVSTCRSVANSVRDMGK